MSTLSLVWKILEGVLAIVSFIEKNKHEIWFQDAVRTFSELREANTDEKRDAMAVAIRDLVNRIRK